MPNPPARLLSGSPDHMDFVNLQAIYDEGVETLSAPGACALDKMTTLLAVDGTDAFTLAAPTFKRQWKRIGQVSGANTPIGTLTVTGMRIATQNVFSGFNQTTAGLDTAPRLLDLYSPDGLVWDIAGMNGVTVA